MIRIFSFVFLFISLSAFAQHKPYKIVILTDIAAEARANQFRAYLLTKPPFNAMGDKIEITTTLMTKDEMKCQNSNPLSPRIITCDNQKLFEMQTRSNAHLAVAFTSSGSGGAGGGIPIASVDYPLQTMLHEMLHTYGLADEYEYSASEQLVYCQPPRPSPNQVFFLDIPPYDSDEYAREKHKNDIPWLGGIPVVKKITNGTALGSVKAIQQKGQQVMGLYRGGSCDKASLPGWRPYLDSIMRGYYDDTIYPFYENVIVKNIEAATGRKLNLPPPMLRCPPKEANLLNIEELTKNMDLILEKYHPKHLHNHDHEDHQH